MTFKNSNPYQISAIINSLQNAKATSASVAKDHGITRGAVMGTQYRFSENSGKIWIVEYQGQAISWSWSQRQCVRVATARLNQENPNDEDEWKSHEVFEMSKQVSLLSVMDYTFAGDPRDC